MIAGHLGVAAAARSRGPAMSPVWLLIACVAPDILDLAYALVGVCSPYGLYSHTLPAAALTAAVLGGGALLATGSRRAGAVVAAVVLAHLPLDLVTGYKLYWPGGPLLGLNLYQRPMLDFLVEMPLALGGWWLLRRSGRGPAWAATVASALALVALQGTVDVLRPGGKPSGCQWGERAAP